MDSDSTSALIKLGTVFVLVLLNGFFVAAEYSLVSVRSTRIEQLVTDGNRMARLVKRAKQDPNRFISATQLGVTMVSLGLGWVAEPTLATLLRPLFDFLPSQGAVITSHLIAAIFAYLSITILEVVLGEQVPKMLALQRSEATILATAGPVNWFAYVFRPLIALLYWLTMTILKLLGLKWEGEHSLVYSETELKMLVTASREKGFLEESEQNLIVRVFGFADILTDEVMVPRTEMTAIPADASIEDVTKIVAEHGYARYPVYGENLDDIIGLFHTKDLYKLLKNHALDRFNLRRLVRAPLLVPQTLPIDDLLTTMKRQHTHIAMVIDEYGGIAGMVTLEDILERIVGEVRDEFESGIDEVQLLPNGEATISGLVSLDEINDRFNLDIEDPIYNTIGGYVFGQLGRRPEIGDEISVNGDILRIEQLDGLRIDRLHLIPIPATDDAISEFSDGALSE